MKLKFTLLFLGMCIKFTSAQSNYTSTCELRGGRAYGYVNNFREAFTLSGKVWFYFYDCQGKFISSESSYEYEYISRGEKEEIDDETAPSTACYCEFKTDEAIKPTGSTPGNNGSSLPAGISTDCVLSGGKAYGYVNAYQDAVTVNGTVYFYFYDAQGNYLSTEDEFEFEYVSKGTREEIETTTAPSKATRCYFSIDQALK